MRNYTVYTVGGQRDRPRCVPVSRPAADESLAEVAATIDALTTDVVGRLVALREQLEPTRARWAGDGAGLDPADEWTIAMAGLFGPSGVLGTINDALFTEHTLRSRGNQP